MNSTDVARTEIGLISDLFKAHGVRAGIDPAGTGSLLARQYWAYAVQLDIRETPERIHKLHKAIANLITNNRQTSTPVRITDSPITIEVPAIQPRPIPWQKATWQIGPHRMIAGMQYDIFRGEEQIVIDLTRQPHLLVVGATGAGKSVLVQMLLSSLAVNTPPSEIEFWFCDLKNDDLVALRDLPHVRAVAIDTASAEQMIAQLYAEKEKRIAQQHQGRRILLVVDEQAELASLTATVNQQNSLLSVGRSIGINLLVATQEPTKQVLGGLSTRNFTPRLVGAVADASAAHYASGRPGTGAELLTRPGGFLHISGPDTDRFQSYLINPQEIPQVVQAVRDQWPAARRQLITAQQPDPEPEPPAIPANVVETFRDVYDEETGELKWGGLTAVIKSLFGPDANTGGANKRRAERVVNQLKATYASRIRRYQS